MPRLGLTAGPISPMPCDWPGAARRGVDVWRVAGRASRPHAATCRRRSEAEYAPPTKGGGEKRVRPPLGAHGRPGGRRRSGAASPVPAWRHRDGPHLGKRHSCRAVLGARSTLPPGGPPGGRAAREDSLAPESHGPPRGGHRPAHVDDELPLLHSPGTRRRVAAGAAESERRCPIAKRIAQVT